MRKDPFRTLDDDKLPAGSVETAKIAAGSIASSQIAAGAVSEYKIAAGSIAAGVWSKPAGRPSWLRRLVVWLLLGWKWRDDR